MDKLEHAKAILGEHFENFVLVVNDAEDPTISYTTFNNPYAAKTLLESGLKVVEDQLFPADAQGYLVEAYDDDDEVTDEDFE